MPMPGTTGEDHTAEQLAVEEDPITAPGAAGMLWR